jgi:16S rRNA G1207 methylase RsmC
MRWVVRRNVAVFCRLQGRHLAAALADSGDKKKILYFGCGMGFLSVTVRKYLPNAIQ